MLPNYSIAVVAIEGELPFKFAGKMDCLCHGLVWTGQPQAFPSDCGSQQRIIMGENGP
jgi:hypothetical protein